MKAYTHLSFWSFTQKNITHIPSSSITAHIHLLSDNKKRFRPLYHVTEISHKNNDDQGAFQQI